MDHHLDKGNQRDLARVKVGAAARGGYCPAERSDRPSQSVKAASVQAHRFASLLLAFALLPAHQTRAQVVSSSDASNQELLREKERSSALRQQQERSADVHLRRPGEADAVRLQFDESPCFVINRLLLEGDAAPQFQWALAAADKAGNETDHATGHCLGAAAIGVVQRRIQNAILKRGFVTTRVLVEAQDLKNGTLKLTLIPGRIRNIKLLPGTNTRATLFNAIPAHPGELLNLRDVEQALENFKRAPTAEADIQIMPADSANAKPGESDLGIRWEQRFPVRVSVSADDSGTKATGKRQGNVTIAYDHLLTLNDLFYASYGHDLEGDSALHGTRAHTVHYSIPYGYSLLAFSGSRSPYYQTVVGATQNYVYRGNSENAAITLSRLFYRDSTRKTTLSFGGWLRASRNFIDDTEVEVQRRRMAGWELGLTHRELIGGGSLELRLNCRHGTGAMGSRPAPEEAFGEGTSRFALIVADGTVSVPFPFFGHALRYSGSWRLQSNRTPLIAQDRFSVGGRYTVRGFDGESSLVAERGWLLRNEFAAALGTSGQELYVGLDHGEVRGPATVALAGKRLTGAVVGLRGQIKRLQYDIFAGAPVRKPELFHTARVAAGFSTTVNV
jgi:hemolysin activation/secretion protein